MLEKILVGYAKDQAGRDAVALAGALAALGHGRLVVAYPYHPLLAKAESQDIERQVAEEVRDLLSKSAVSNGAPGSLAQELSFHWTSSPWPIHALHELASYEGAEAIVIGAAKQDIADRLHLSLMERMVHGAPCAVAVAPAGYAEAIGGEDATLKRIGVGFADSPEGREAVELARWLAERSGGGVCVIAGSGLEPALASYAFSSPALGQVEEELYGQISEELERFCAALPSGVPLARETVRGDPASILVERSARLDLLVLGSRAYGPLRHALLGSVSARAMREARCPVLVVPRGPLTGAPRPPVGGPRQAVASRAADGRHRRSSV